MRPAFVCPRCRGPLLPEPDGFACTPCATRYPVLFGIPDFRLAPDPYLSLEEERAKAGRLHGLAAEMSFEALLDAYYAMTDDVPGPLATKFAAYVRGGVSRGETVLDRLAGAGPLLDAGCGAGGLLVAAGRQGRAATGLDIALRWLVIAAKRLEEEGLPADLVCADLRAPPFPDGSFGAIAAVDVLEHLGEQSQASEAIARLAAPGARLYVAAANRHTLAPYPLAGLWGVGVLPRGLRSWYLKARRGLDTLRNATPVAPTAVARRFRRAGLTVQVLAPLEIRPAYGTALGPLARRALPLYAKLRTAPGLGRLIVQASPAFELILVKPEGPGGGGN